MTKEELYEKAKKASDCISGLGTTVVAVKSDELGGTQLMVNGSDIEVLCIIAGLIEQSARRSDISPRAILALIDDFFKYKEKEEERKADTMTP